MTQNNSLELMLIFVPVLLILNAFDAPDWMLFIILMAMLLVLAFFFGVIKIRIWWGSAHRSTQGE